MPTPFTIVKRQIVDEYHADGWLAARSHYRNGVLHREDGPAIEVFDQTGALTYYTYWLHDEQIDSEKFEDAVRVLCGERGES